MTRTHPLESKPDAAVAVYLDFDGFSGNGFGGNQTFAPYSINSDATTYNAQEQTNIIEGWKRIAAHFALEESIMRKHRYDEYEAHKQEHEHLLDEIRDIMDGAEGRYGDALSATVRDWFVNHFKSKDARRHRKLGV